MGATTVRFTFTDPDQAEPLPQVSGSPSDSLSRQVLRPGSVACEGHRWPQPVRGTIVAMCRADHADQAMGMNSSGNPG